MTFDNTQPSASLLQESNAAKNHVIEQALRAEQERAVKELDQSTNEGGIVNLRGEAKSGKTFLAWYIARSRDDWRYHPWLPTPTPVTTRNVIVDNVAATRVASRRLREIKTFDGATTVVGVSRQPLPEASVMVSL